MPAVGALSIIIFCSGEVELEQHRKELTNLMFDVKKELGESPNQVWISQCSTEDKVSRGSPRGDRKKLDKLEETLDEVKKIHVKVMAEVQTIRRDIRSKN
ncbi:hypothetical protein IW262DRAFT_1453892 [Armillaria fumosa]|nr:hypothetical protein IW262DRAFT_1453892 [Armillaria fumosa]